ncbi:MAG: serine/threonine-protein kinase [Gemmatales bacterium]|nr:serine/threonine protein kinase [Gemmatales bacterium]MDW7994556.1 serine/threonine-protein kinase [Gemmatales bacterium]
MTDPTLPNAAVPLSQTVAAGSSDLSGKVLADFRLIRKLGEGGMGQVYLAEQLSLRRRVAIKLLKSDLANHDVSLKRFRAEAKIVAQLNHPNIVQVYAFGECDGLHYMALEYVDGRNLRDYLRRHNTAPLAMALHILHQVALALQRAAEVGLVHRDIKPENILLTRRGEVKVADFGLSRMTHGEEAQRLTQTGMTIGTPLYMSPEQVQGQPLDIRSDIYSLGVTCYHLLAGRPPFSGENAFAVAVQHVQAEPPPLQSFRPDLPEEVCALVHKMMAKRPEDRFQTPAELLRAVVALQERFLKDVWTTSSLPNVSKDPCATLALDAAKSTRTLPIHATLAHRVKRWLSWLTAVALSLLVAFWLGYAMSQHWWNAPTVIPDSTSFEEPQDFPTAREQEEALLVLVRVTERPDKDMVKLRQGVQHRLDLAVLLLRSYSEDRTALERAEKLFRDWMQSMVEAYALVGELGLAIVLAYRDRPLESNERFLAVLKRSPNLQRPAYGLTPFLQPEFYRLVVRALEHNYVNCLAQRIPFPNELSRLRQELPAKPRVGKPTS